MRRYDLLRTFREVALAIWTDKRIVERPECIVAIEPIGPAPTSFCAGVNSCDGIN